MNADDLLNRCLALLQGAIRASGQTQTEIDHRIGRRKGYLSHVFQRRVDLKLIDLLLALEALDLEPRRFFGALAASATTGGSGVLELLASRVEGPVELHRSSAGGALASSSPPAVDPVLEERVRTALRSILSQMGQSHQAHRA
ncbi:MAG TPA: hypothetical protein VF017_06355 [Thermoanaerobaculia bacterium]|nr:hypothetical protein [Thermoanaerobaculia bacterium]